RRAALVEAVIVAGDGAGADVGPGADLGIAEIAQVIGLGAGVEPGILGLDEVADPGALADATAVAQPGERADHSAALDGSTLDVAVAQDLDLVGDGDAEAEADPGADRDVAAQPRVGGEEDAGGIDQGGAAFHRGAAQA